MKSQDRIGPMTAQQGIQAALESAPEHLTQLCAANEATRDAVNIQETPEVAVPAIQALAANIRGEVITRGHEGYDRARQVWNAMIDKRPALIIRCVNETDVLTAVQFARTHNLMVAVRGGGHNIAGNATCDGGMLIDLSPMKSMYIDPIRHTVRAEPGLTWGEFDHETQALRLALIQAVFER